MSGITLSHINNWLKIRYLDNETLLNKTLLMPEKSPLFRLLTKQEASSEGKSWQIAIRGSQKKTSGRDFDTVQKRVKAGSTGRRLVFTHQMVENFDEIRMDRMAYLSSRKTEAIFFAALRDEIDQTIKQMNEDILRALYSGSANESIGKVSSLGTQVNATSSKDGSLPIIIDTAVSNILHFEEGMHVEFASAVYDGSTDARKGGNAGTGILSYPIKSINRSKNTITIVLVNNNSAGTGATATATPAANDLIFKEGEYLLSESSGTHLKGLIDFAPATIPVDDNFLGVNRNIDKERLRGHYYKPVKKTGASAADTGSQIYDAIVTATIDTLKYFGAYEFDMVIANPEVLKHLQLSEVFKRGVRWISDNNESMRKGTLGFAAFDLITPRGTVPFVFDPYCLEKQVFGLSGSTWVIKYLSESPGNIVNFRQEKGNRVFEVRDASSIQMMVESFHFLGSYCPGSLMRVDLSNLF